MHEFRNPALLLLARVAVKAGLIETEEDLLDEDIETVLIRAELQASDIKDLKSAVARLEKEVARLQEDRDAWENEANRLNNILIGETK